MPKCKHRRAHGTGSLELRGKIWYAVYHLPDGRKKVESTRTSVKSEAEQFLTDKTRVLLMRTDKAKLELLESQISSLSKDIKEVEMLQRRVLLSNAFEVYFKRGYSLNIADSTKEKYEKTYRLLLDYFRDKVLYLDEINKSDALEFLGILRDKYCAGSYNVHLGFLKLMCKKLGLPELFGECEYLDEPKSTREAFTVEEIQRVATHLKEHRSDQFQMYWKLLCMTGQRTEDIVSIKWSEMDFKKRAITLMPLKTRRHKKIVSIPMFDSLYEALSAFPHYDKEYVLPDMLRRYNKHTLKSAMKVVFNRCGIKTNFRDKQGRWHSFKSTHSTRHFFVSLCANSGIPLDIVKSMTGHCPEVIQIYYHPNLEVCRERMSKIDFFAGKPNAPSSPSTDAEEGGQKVFVQMTKDVKDRLDKLRGELSISEYLSKILTHEENVIEISGKEGSDTDDIELARKSVNKFLNLVPEVEGARVA